MTYIFTFAGVATTAAGAVATTAATTAATTVAGAMAGASEHSLRSAHSFQRISRNPMKSLSCSLSVREVTGIALLG